MGKIDNQGIWEKIQNSVQETERLMGQKKYNLSMLITTVIILLNTLFKVYKLGLFYGITAILTGVMGVVIIVNAKKSAERWLS